MHTVPPRCALSHISALTHKTDKTNKQTKQVEKRNDPLARDYNRVMRSLAIVVLSAISDQTRGFAVRLLADTARLQTAIHAAAHNQGHHQRTRNANQNPTGFHPAHTHKIRQQHERKRDRTLQGRTTGCRVPTWQQRKHNSGTEEPGGMRTNRREASQTEAQRPPNQPGHHSSAPQSYSHHHHHTSADECEGSLYCCVCVCVERTTYPTVLATRSYTV